MIRSIAFLFLLTLLPLAAAPKSDLDAAKQVAAARAILDPWHATSPKPADRKLHLVYWTPSDREPAADHEARLKRMMEHIRGFYAQEMERLGFGPRTFNLDYDKGGSLRIHLVKGAGPYADYDVQSGRQVRKECLPVLQKAGIDADRETILIFCNLATWDEEKLVFRHKSPYYAGGSHRQGTAWQLDSPELDTINLPKTEPMMRDGQYGRISLGKHNSIFIGGIAHELGHALSLPHNLARPDEAVRGTALMGAGNRTYADELRKEGKGSFLTLAHALRLASHPQFSGSIKGMSHPTRAEFTDLAVRADGRSFHFSGKVTSDIPVYALVAYCDPEGGGDYNSTTATAVPDKNGKFSLHCRGLASGKPASLRIVACHVNGATTQTKTGAKLTFAYSVNRDGTPDVAGIRQRFALAPLLDALTKRRGKAAVEKALADLKTTAPDERTVRLADRLVAALGKQPAKPSPRDVPATSDSIPLADTRPASATVGWGRPAYNFAPNNTLLLEAGGRVFETGIYAHAPAEHRYQLDGKWKRLTGHCGIVGNHGSVAFRIRGDGKKLWSSRTTKAGTVHRYDLDLTGVKSLQLIVDNGGDDTRGDWGFWLEPVLTR